MFTWNRCEGTFFNHQKRLNRLAGLPTTGKHLTQRMRRTHLTLWHIAGQDATKRAQHSSPSVTTRHYLDESLLPQLDPSEVLPQIDTPDANYVAPPPKAIRDDVMTPEERRDRLVGWIRKRGGSTTARAIVKNTLAGYANSDEAKAALDELAAMGLGEWRPRPRTKGKPTRDFYLF